MGGLVEVVHVSTCCLVQLQPITAARWPSRPLFRRSLSRPPIGACPIGRSNDYSSTSGGGDTPPLAQSMASPLAACPMLRDGGAFARAQVRAHACRARYVNMEGRDSCLAVRSRFRASMGLHCCMGVCDTQASWIV